MWSLSNSKADTLLLENGKSDKKFVEKKSDEFLRLCCPNEKDSLDADDDDKAELFEKLIAESFRLEKIEFCRTLFEQTRLFNPEES